MKKILAMLLAVALVASLAVPALAAGAPTKYHCACGAKVFASAEETTPSIRNEACAAGCLESKNLAWLPLSENIVTSGTTTSLPVRGNFYLDKDINVSYTTYAQILRIDLNGHTLSRTQNRVIHMSGSNAQQLVITDASEAKNGVLQSNKYAAGNTGAVLQVDNGVCYMFAGTINGGAAKNTAAVPAKGGSVYVSASETNVSNFWMYGGTITGGSAQSGGNVVVTGANAQFTMRGGAIVDGSTPGTDQQHGGNIRVDSGAKFTVSGGIIKDGVANGMYEQAPSGGGNIVAVNNGTVVTVSGTAQILGGTAQNATANSIWVGNGATLNVKGGKIEKEIFVRNEAGKEGYMNVTGGEFGSNNVSAYVPFTDGKLTLTGDLKFDGGLDIAEDVTINLAGYKIDGGVNVAVEKVLTLADTSSDDYTTAGKMVKVTGEGTVKSDAVVNGKKYVAIKETVGEDTYYSAHRIYLAVTSSVLSNGCSAMNFKTVLRCNDYVAKRIEEYGVTVNGNFEAYKNADLVAGGDWNQKTTQLTGFLKGNAGDAEFAATDVQVNATIKLGETVINSAVKTRSLKTMVETVAEGWAGLDADQQTTLKTLYKDFGATAGMDSWNIPAEMKAN